VKGGDARSACALPWDQFLLIGIADCATHHYQIKLRNF